MQQVIDRFRSKVEINTDVGIVTKTYASHISDIYINREVKWLRKISPYDVCPRLVDYVGRTIVMTYAGVQISAQELPRNWEKQLEEIADVLVKVCCFYSDCKQDHLRVLDGKIRLIDFGQTRTANVSRGWIPNKRRRTFLNIGRELEANQKK